MSMTLLRARIDRAARSARKKAHRSPFLRRLFKRFLYPELLSVCLTTRCTLRCFFCSRGKNFVGEDFKFDNIYKLQKPLKHARIIDLTGWGEPFLYPRIKDVVNYIYSINQRDDLIQITTNGTLLTKEFGLLMNDRLRTLIISLNAAQEDTYRRDMGGNLSNTLSRISDFLSVLSSSSRQKVTLHFVASRRNYLEIPDFINVAKGVGVGNVSIGNFLVNEPEEIPLTLLTIKHEYNEIIEEARKKSELAGIGFAARKFFAESPHLKVGLCEDPFFSCFVGVDGTVNPCCFSGHFTIGNVYAQPFDKVWFGRDYGRLRQTRYLPCCSSCTPYTPFDDFRTHVLAFLKEKPGYQAYFDGLERGSGDNGSGK